MSKPVLEKNRKYSKYKSDRARLARIKGKDAIANSFYPYNERSSKAYLSLQAHTGHTRTITSEFPSDKFTAPSFNIPLE